MTFGRFNKTHFILSFVCFLRFSQDTSLPIEHCRHHAGGEKWKSGEESRIYKIISQPDWRIAGKVFLNGDMFGKKIRDAEEFMPSPEYIEKWRKANRPDFIYENSLPQSFGANEKSRSLHANHHTLTEVIRRYGTKRKIDEWYTSCFFNTIFDLCQRFVLIFEESKKALCFSELV